MGYHEMRDYSLQGSSLLDEVEELLGEFLIGQRLSSRDVFLERVKENIFVKIKPFCDC